jgi:predicted O-methyltransferase YrrM
MNPVLENILRSGATESETGELIKVDASAVPLEEGKFLQEIITDCKPVLSLEVGLAFGVSALFICEALSNTPNAHHIILDPYQSSGSWKGSGLRNLEKAGYGHLIEFHNQFLALGSPPTGSPRGQTRFRFRRRPAHFRLRTA